MKGDKQSVQKYSETAEPCSNHKNVHLCRTDRLFVFIRLNKSEINDNRVTSPSTVVWVIEM